MTSSVKVSALTIEFRKLRANVRFSDGLLEGWRAYSRLVRIRQKFLFTGKIV
jgi:hypothetical protein